MSRADEAVERDPAAMTAAEFRIARERLGVTGEWLAGKLGVADRTVRRWEADKAAIPEGAARDLEDLESATDEWIAQVLDVLRADEPTDDGEWWVTTYASDAAYRLEHPGLDWPAGWHRAAMGRVAEALPGVRLRFAGDPS